MTGLTQVSLRPSVLTYLQFLFIVMWEIWGVETGHGQLLWRLMVPRYHLYSIWAISLSLVEIVLSTVLTSLSVISKRFSCQREWSQILAVNTRFSFFAFFQNQINNNGNFHDNDNDENERCCCSMNGTAIPEERKIWLLLILTGVNPMPFWLLRMLYHWAIGNSR